MKLFFKYKFLDSVLFDDQHIPSSNTKSHKEGSFLLSD